ncbi:MAG TPA: DUF5009 domain-containing protein [Gemmataceae bacterium]|nr:DUF5009 domain-containing protein [Gemmataceae bacterium]
MATEVREPQVTTLPSARPAGTAVRISKPARLVSLDAFRGFIMILLTMEGFGLYKVAQTMLHQPGAHPFWGVVGYQFEHTEWTGCSFWDLIQPSFMFMVGVAMPFSIASRRARGDSEAKLLGHALWRSFALVVLGIFLMSNNKLMPNYTFENVLTQIGLGYFFVFLLAGRGWRVQLGAVALILVGYWLLFALWPVPGPDFDYAQVGVPSDWPHLTGLFAHWDKNTNAAAAFDSWFLNLFPQKGGRFLFNAGGYQTLNFIPSMATMLFGLMAGELLRGPRSRGAKFLRLVLAALVCLAVGWALDQTVCPSVKRIWTPSWAVFSTGWTLLMLAGFFLIVDGWGFRRWSLPLVVVGMNSIAIYCMAMTLKGWIAGRLQCHISPHIFDGMYGPMVRATVIGFVLWLVCLWLYRRRIFLKI